MAYAKAIAVVVSMKMKMINLSGLRSGHCMLLVSDIARSYTFESSSYDLLASAFIIRAFRCWNPPLLPS